MIIFRIGLWLILSDIYCDWGNVMWAQWGFMWCCIQNIWSLIVSKVHGYYLHYFCSFACGGKKSSKIQIDIFTLTETFNYILTKFLSNSFTSWTSHTSLTFQTFWIFQTQMGSIFHRFHQNQMRFWLMFSTSVTCSFKRKHDGSTEMLFSFV